MAIRIGTIFVYNGPTLSKPEKMRELEEMASRFEAAKRRAFETRELMKEKIEEREARENG